MESTGDIVAKEINILRLMYTPFQFEWLSPKNYSKNDNYLSHRRTVIIVNLERVCNNGLLTKTRLIAIKPQITT